MTPSAATANQSRPFGHFTRRASASGSRRRKPSPKRNTASVTGSLAPSAKRVTAAAIPPNALDATAASTPACSIVPLDNRAMRLVVLIVLVVLAVWLIRRAFLTSSSKSRNAPPRQGNLEGDLVACARCGMHLPRSEAREAGGRLYCGEEHARLGARP